MIFKKVLDKHTSMCYRTNMKDIITCGIQFTIAACIGGLIGFGLFYCLIQTIK